MAYYTIQLQWGRVLWDAESLNEEKLAHYLTRFNGAASCGTRKEGTEVVTIWRVRASMGPRLVGRGKSFPSVVVKKFLYGLQWGRVLWDAESNYQLSKVHGGLPLQWGRVLWDAERA